MVGEQTYDFKHDELIPLGLVLDGSVFYPVDE
jgi:hypothetical protein